MHMTSVVPQKKDLELETTYSIFPMRMSCIRLSRFRRTGRTIGSSLLRFLLGMAPKPDHAFVMAIHAVYALRCLGKDKLVDPVFTHFTLEAMRVIGVVARHDSLVQNW
jgi:hypothetical protein